MKQGSNSAPGVVRKNNWVTFWLGRLCFGPAAYKDLVLLYRFLREIDDYVDAPGRSYRDAKVFLKRHRCWIEEAYTRPELCPVRLISPVIEYDRKNGRRLEPVIAGMLDVFEFDAQRKGQVVSRDELLSYSKALTRCYVGMLLAFLDGPGDCRTAGEVLAHACHRVHMLRDYHEDSKLGYINVPQEALRKHGLNVLGSSDKDLRAYVREESGSIAALFKQGKDELARTARLRVKIIGAMYCFHYETILHRLEDSSYCLQRNYPAGLSDLPRIVRFAARLALLHVLPRTRRLNSRVREHH